MANKESKLTVTQLDFDGIKNNLKEFMRAQSEFTDYDFEASGLSALLDVLAYNTHYMGWYMNMIANEMFLDTALTRPSVVSHAKLIGYTPRSSIASKATINLAFTETSSGSYTAATATLPRFSRFVSRGFDGRNYIFVNPTAEVMISSGGSFTANNVEIKQGLPQFYTFTHSQATNDKQVFVLPDFNIDTTTLQVQVQVSNQNINKTTFTLAQDATEVEFNSRVYYLEENRNGKYQIYFGKNIVGEGLEDGNIVIVSYLVTSGSDAANGLDEFNLVDGITGLTASLTTVSESASGDVAESIDDIRLMAPKAFISQNRGVTKNDYITLINRKYPYFSAVTVWGGEENDPPVFGKVFFSVKPISNYQITTAEIDYVANKVIAPYSVVTVKPEYVAPDYIFLNLEVNLQYDSTKTTRTESQIKDVVLNAVRNYANTNLNSFDITYKNSRIVREIDNSEESIDNNEVLVSLEKRFRPIPGRAKDYVIDFGIPLSQGTANKKVFVPTGFRYLDNTGVLRTAYLEEVLQSYTGISGALITNPGIGYEEAPTLTVDGDGVGAELQAVIVNGKITRVDVINNGTDYTSAVINISGGGGLYASLSPIIGAKTGKLRVFYYDDNLVKRVINDEIGTIFYDEGYIQLTSFAPVRIFDAYNTMVVKAYPKNSIFSASRNKIFALDITDPESIQVNVGAVRV